MSRLQAEYGVDAAYEGANFAIARWVSCDDRKKLEAFQKAMQGSLAMDAEGHLAFLGASAWRLTNATEEWPEVTFLNTKEHN
jgi:peptide chain release factor 3